MGIADRGAAAVAMAKAESPGQEYIWRRCAVAPWMVEKLAAVVLHAGKKETSC